MCDKSLLIVLIISLSSFKETKPEGDWKSISVDNAKETKSETSQMISNEIQRDLLHMNVLRLSTKERPQCRYHYFDRQTLL